MTDAPILIAGGGIGGLTAALALAKAGCRVHVFERAPAFSEVGAGLQISPNAARVLLALGLDARLDPVLGKPQALVISSGTTGTQLLEMPLGDVAERRWGAPHWVVHRADLIAALADAAAAEPLITLTLDARVEGSAETPDGVDVRIGSADGFRTVAGRALVAADGLWSRTRRDLIGDVPPTDTGRRAFRATVPVDRVPSELRANNTGLWLAPNTHLVHYPLRGGAIVNIVAIASEDRGEAGWDTAAQRDEVLARFSHWHPLPRALLATPENWTCWDLFDRPPDKSWPGTRIALLGDAAHPMVPFLAQGASMAIEDAACLARCLSENEVVPALARYRAERLPRVGRVQTEARRNGTVFHLPEPFATARDFGLKLMGSEALAARYDWLYGARI